MREDITTLRPSTSSTSSTASMLGECYKTSLEEEARSLRTAGPRPALKAGFGAAPQPPGGLED